MQIEFEFEFLNQSSKIRTLFNVTNYNNNNHEMRLQMQIVHHLHLSKTVTHSNRYVFNWRLNLLWPVKGDMQRYITKFMKSGF